MEGSFPSKLTQSIILFAHFREVSIVNRHTVLIFEMFPFPEPQQHNMTNVRQQSINDAFIIALFKTFAYKESLRSGRNIPPKGSNAAETPPHR